MMTELTDFLPITLGFNPAFITFRKKFDECLEELEINAGDYEYRMKKQKNLNKKNMQFLLLELKDYIRKLMKKIYGCKDYPKYEGCIYKSGYIFKINDRFQNTLHYKLKDKNRNNISFQKNYSYTSQDAEKNIIYHPHSYEIKTWVQADNKYTYEKVIVKPEDMIKVRCLDLRMHYEHTRTYKYDATKIKKYTANGKTSNKGLKAINYYTIENNSVKDSDRGGWVFGGIKINSMQKFAEQNGFKVEKGKKYLYGDYANWVLKTLN